MVMTLLFVILPDTPSNRIPRRRSFPSKQPKASVNEVVTPRLFTFAVDPEEPLSTAPRNPSGGSTAVMVCPFPSTVPPGGIWIVTMVVQSASNVHVGAKTGTQGGSNTVPSSELTSTALIVCVGPRGEPLAPARRLDRKQRAAQLRRTWLSQT